MNSMRKNSLTFLLIITISFGAFYTVDAYSSEIVYNIIDTTVASSESVVIQSDDIGWRYKTINGVLYKRLYNFSKKKWIGNWQRA
jgi:hypothetical protein